MLRLVAALLVAAVAHQALADVRPASQPRSDPISAARAPHRKFPCRIAINCPRRSPSRSPAHRRTATTAATARASSRPTCPQRSTFPPRLTLAAVAAPRRDSHARSCSNNRLDYTASDGQAAQEVCVSCNASQNAQNTQTCTYVQVVSAIEAWFVPLSLTRSAHLAAARAATSSPTRAASPCSTLPSTAAARVRARTRRATRRCTWFAMRVPFVPSRPS